MQLAVAPKISMYFNPSQLRLWLAPEKVWGAHCEEERLRTCQHRGLWQYYRQMGLTTLAEAVDLARLPPRSWKLNKIDINIMEIPRPKEPHIMGFRLPMRSRKNVG